MKTWTLFFLISIYFEMSGFWKNYNINHIALMQHTRKGEGRSGKVFRDVFKLLVMIEEDNNDKKNNLNNSG